MAPQLRRAPATQGIDTAEQALVAPLLNPAPMDVMQDLITFARVGGYGFDATLHVNYGGKTGDIHYRT